MATPQALAATPPTTPKSSSSAAAAAAPFPAPAPAPAPVAGGLSWREQVILVSTYLTQVRDLAQSQQREQYRAAVEELARRIGIVIGRAKELGLGELVRPMLRLASTLP